VGLCGAGDLLHEGSVLQDLQGLLLALPVLGTDDNEGAAIAAGNFQRLMVDEDFLDMLPKAIAELVDGDSFRLSLPQRTGWPYSIWEGCQKAKSPLSRASGMS
jgi:hypothetical protein